MNLEDIERRAYHLGDKHFELYVSSDDDHADISGAIGSAVKEALTTLGTPVRDKGIWLEESQIDRLERSAGTDAYINIYASTVKFNDAMTPFYSAKDSLSKEELDTLIDAYVEFKGHTDAFVKDLLTRFR